MRKSVIRSKVQDLLVRFSIEEAPISLETITNGLDLNVVEKELDISVSGALIAEKKTILVNSLHHEHRKRFTIAHEIGHWLLHAPEQSNNLFIDESLTFYRNDNSSTGVYADEIDANSFAAELLMPENYLKDYLRDNRVDIFDTFSSQNLAAKFNVSEQAVAVRLQSLGLIPML